MMAHNGAKFVRQYKVVQARDVRRERQFEDELDRSTQMMAGLVARGSSPSQGAIRAEAAVRLANAVAELPDHYRDAIVLHHLQGRPIKDVAAAMNRTEDSIKKLLARALIRLQSELRSLI
jgi:RNA polymerase sigma-70 factor (ECF subfamily)